MKLLKNLEIVDVMKGIANRHEKPVSAVAIRFILDHLPGSVVLCGSKRPAQVMENVRGADWQLDADELEALERISG